MYVLMVESMKAAVCCAQDLRIGGAMLSTWLVSLDLRVGFALACACSGSCQMAAEWCSH